MVTLVDRRFMLISNLQMRAISWNATHFTMQYIQGHVDDGLAELLRPPYHWVEAFVGGAYKIGSRTMSPIILVSDQPCSTFRGRLTLKKSALPLEDIY